MLSFFTERGGLLTLKESSARQGGQATVYTLQQDERLVAKVYHNLPDPETVLKLRWMIEHPPLDPTRGSGHASFAWPQEMLFNRERQPVGYLMPRVRLHFSLFDVFNPARRKKKFIPVTWQGLHSIAKNVASDVAALHERDYIVGDMNESNILVNPDTRVTLIDTDSFQVRAGDHLFACPVGKEDYTAPELIGVDFSHAVRSPASDSFALAVLIYQLLMEGSHPFRGMWRGRGETPLISEKIRKGNFPFGPNKGLNDPLTGSRPNFYDLSRELRELFQRAFVIGHKNPQARPLPQEWQKVLDLGALKTCERNSAHFYYAHSPGCPWCERENSRENARPLPAVPARAGVPGSKPAKPASKPASIPAAAPQITILTTRLDAGVLKPGQTAAPKFYVTHNASSPPVLSLQSDSPWLIVPHAQISLNQSITAVNLKIEPRRLHELAQKQYSAQLTLSGPGNLNKKIEVVFSLVIPELSVSPQKIDFGGVPFGSLETREVTLTNSGSGVLKGSLISNCAWLGLSEAAFSIDPGGTQVFQARVDALRLAELSTRERQTGSIHISSDGGDFHIPVGAVVGTPNLELSIHQVALGTLSAGTALTRTITVHNSGSAILRLKVRMAQAQPWLQVSPAAIACPPGQRRQIRLSLDSARVEPAPEPVPLHNSIELLINEGVYPIPVEGTILTPFLALDPCEIHLGVLEHGASVEASVRLQNRGQADLKLRLQQREPWLELSATNLLLHPGETTDVPLRIQTQGLPLEPGRKSWRGSLLLHSNGGSLALPVAFELVGAQLFIPEPVLELGRVSALLQPQRSLTLVNQGEGELRGVFLSCPTWIQPGQSSFCLPPHSEARIGLRIAGEKLYARPPEAGPEKIYIQSNGGDQIVLVQAQAWPSILQVGVHFWGEQDGTGKWRLKNRGGVGLELELEQNTGAAAQRQALAPFEARELAFPGAAEVLAGMGNLRVNSAHGELRCTMGLAGELEQVEAVVSLGETGHLHLVKIPAGKFWLGSTAERDPYMQARRERSFCLLETGAYWMGKYPVTNAQYLQFLEETAQPVPSSPGLPDHPAVNVSWEDAQAFCAWASRATGLPFGLPDELLWEKAARGLEGSLFPWGDTPPTPRLAAFNASGTHAVGSFSPQSDSPFGCADMSGNVAQWVDAEDGLPVLKGGSWFSPDPASLRCAARRRENPGTRRDFIGFRCCLRLQS